MGTFDPSTFRDRYPDTLREMIQAKLKGLPLVSQPARAPAPVIGLMSECGSKVSGSVDLGLLGVCRRGAAKCSE